MEENTAKGILRRFGGESMGEAEDGPVDTQQASTGEEIRTGAPDAGEAENSAGQSREKAFRALMEGEYKDLFTAYFQETFNRRFREQKQMREELERARAVVRAAAERFGPRSEAALAAAIRGEAAGKAEGKAGDGRAEEALETAVQKAREEAARQVMDNIRARCARPAENALQAGIVPFRGGAASGLSRAQREELARRAALGERIEL